jgi:prephenate dehydrogenase
MVPDTLGLIGLGGLGGAVATRAARLGVPRILGFDPSTKEGVAAVRAGAVTELLHDAVSVIKRSEFVVIGGRARDAVEVLRAHGGLIATGHAICTDLADLKRPIAATAARAGLQHRFAGSHPMTRPMGSTFGSVHAEVLDQALVYVTPIEGGEAAASEVSDFWARVIGAHPVTTTADRHDEVVAWTRDLPLAAAAAVSFALARSGPSGVSPVEDTLDATRPALRDPEASTRALLNNRDNVLAILDVLQAAATDLRVALEAGDVRAVRELIGEAQAWRKRYGR